MSRAFITIFALILSAASVAAATTQGDWGFGPRLGYTDTGPTDQIHIGGHVWIPNLTPNIHLLPSVEIGFGGGTLLAGNADVIYEFTELASGPWRWYGGGGPMLTHSSRDGRSRSDFALSLTAGATYFLTTNRHLLGELRLGLEDAPDIKITLGVVFN